MQPVTHGAPWKGKGFYEVKQFFCLLTALAVLLSAGCASQPQPPQETAVSSAESSLNVRYDPSCYGSGWLDTAVTAFEELNPGVKVSLVPDSAITATVAQAFSTSGAVPDVLLMPPTNWQAYAQKGWLADLSHLLTQNVDGQTLGERLQPDLRGFGRYGRGNYVLPLCDGVSGFLYNASMFARYGWAVPSTMKDLLALLPEIKAKGIAPFTWAGKEQNAWSGVVDSWWEQLSGAKGISTFLAMKSAAVYSDAARLKALELYQTIVTNETNCIGMPQSLDTEGSLEQLIGGRAAMMPGESWMVPLYHSLMGQDVVIRLARAPAPDGAALPRAYDATSGAFVCVPAHAKNPELAKSFVLCLSKNSVSTAFFEKTATPSAFNGLPDSALLEQAAAQSRAATAASLAASGLANVSSADVSSAQAAASSTIAAAGAWADPFAQSVYELVTSSVPLRLYSQSPVYYNSLLNWPGSGEPFNDIYFGTHTAQQIFTEDAAYAKQNWSAAGRVDSALTPPKPISSAVSGTDSSDVSGISGVPQTASSAAPTVQP